VREYVTDKIAGYEGLPNTFEPMILSAHSELLKPCLGYSKFEVDNMCITGNWFGFSRGSC
jgi:hypothetical protein